ncbi:MAG TPA: hypothetical protein PKY27_06320 [Arachnia sp.]|nr:hypothetical protein [Arachnia sp.]HQD21854.1 hypothetical protein [Arachnia sp.]
MTRFRFWEPIPQSVAMRTLDGQTILALPPNSTDALVVTVQVYEGNIYLRHARLPNLDKPARLTGADSTLGVNLIKLFKMPTQVECIAIPSIEWPGRGGGLRFRGPVAAVGALASGTGLLALGGVAGAALALPVAAAVGGGLWALLRRRRGARILTAGDLHLDGSNLVDYAIARRLGERPDVLSDDGRTARASRRIDDIRADYGRRAADIAYRIENSALFDAAVPTTAAFEAALVRCDAEAPALSPSELEGLATDLEISYSVAVDHAETVGFQHLPSTARDDARRAHKAAQLADGAATDGEREAAVAQVIRILSSLALYYLPAPEAARRELTDGRLG